MNPKITSGRIVVAVIRIAGELMERPAIVTRTWDGESTAVQATVFPDGSNDGLPAAVPKSWLQYDENGTKEDSWHWPTLASASAQQHTGKRVDWVEMYALVSDLCSQIERMDACDKATIASVTASQLLTKIREASKP